MLVRSDHLHLGRCRRTTLFQQRIEMCAVKIGKAE